MGSLCYILAETERDSPVRLLKDAWLWQVVMKYAYYVLNRNQHLCWKEASSTSVSACQSIKGMEVNCTVCNSFQNSLKTRRMITDKKETTTKHLIRFCLKCWWRFLTHGWWVCGPGEVPRHCNSQELQLARKKITHLFTFSFEHQINYLLKAL